MVKDLAVKVSIKEPVEITHFSVPKFRTKNEIPTEKEEGLYFEIFCVLVLVRMWMRCKICYQFSFIIVYRKQILLKIIPLLMLTQSIIVKFYYVSVFCLSLCCIFA